MEKICQVKELISQVNDEGGYFIDFVNTKDIEAGIISLHPGEKDLQQPHSVDEIYYVIEGFAYIEIEGISKAIKEKDIIFIPAKSRHRFHGNNQDLVVLYVLGR
ncbi:MAG TPA: cupin domain-containing protein [Nitrososphaeraceae archaeon]|nr:cupin domain-containing protein [Nitrososphaeraceae archaeon]